LEKKEQRNRVAVFVDGSNLFHLQKNILNSFIDLEKLLEFIGQYGDIVDAYYYTGQDLQNEDNKQHGFLDKLPHMGFSVVTKSLKSMYDDTTGKTVKKANMDVELVLDMFNTIDNYDMAVLISGDGDFVRALELLRAKGKTFKVLSTPAMTASDLLKLAGMHYIDLLSIQDKLKRDWL
jgi:uncharacterized LabA/DUF88 family protein